MGETVTSTAGNSEPQEIWTIQRLLAWTRDWLQQQGSPTARLDGELLLGEVLKLRRLDLLLRFDQPVQKDELAAFKALIRRRAKGEPVAYILGRKEFYGIELEVTPAVLVPRPETESLVDVALAHLRAEDAPDGPVLDLCTGSGAIALAIGDELRKAAKPRAILATDLSPQALEVAARNTAKLGLQEQVALRQGDLWAAVPAGETYAAIVSNPPYVLTSALAGLDRDVRSFEPKLALDGGPQGLDVLTRIAEQAAAHLRPGGLLAVELGSRAQGQAFAAQLAAGGLPDARVEPVLGGPTCVVSVKRP